MEFQNLGQHCDFFECKQLDFLPFKCLGCSKTFCLDHRSFKAHSCTESNGSVEAPECPLCHQVVQIKKGDDINLKVDEHINKGCPKELDIRNNYCTFKNCKNTEVVPFICNKCLHNFCVSHRLPPDHDCEKVLEQTQPQNNELKQLHLEARNNRKQRIDQLIKQQSQTQPTAKKVQMIKMKTKAKGNQNIPQEQRFYLEVVYPMDSGVQPKLMFFNPNWTIGKILDVVASEGGIENRNNQPGAEKLHLISLKSGQSIPTSLPLKDCSEVLQSGDSILLERMDNIAQQL